MIEQKEFDMDRELLILSHMIMNNAVANAANSRYISGELKSNHFTEYFKRIFQWTIKYYGTHEKPPKKAIQDIWERKKKSFNKTNRELMEGYLLRLSEKYVEFQEQGIDPDYIQREVIPDFIRDKEINLRLDKVQRLVDQGDLEDAEKILVEYKPISIEIESQDLGVISPLTIEDVSDSARQEDHFQDVGYEFEGDLKEIIGPLKKSWLVAVTGVEKSGKSYLLDEIGFDAATSQDKKVLKINLELSKSLQRLRTQKRISLTCDKYQEGVNVYPIFDCENNQRGTCGVKEMQRKMSKKTPLITSPGDVVSYFKRRSWSICDECRFKKTRANAEFRKRFIPAIWFDHCYLKAIKPRLVKRVIKKNSHFINGLDNFRVKCFPRFSVTFDEVRSFIFRYIDKYKWHPDIILFDYVDILAQQDNDIRMDVDKKWKQASRLAGELNCLVLNADQANKAGRTQYMLDKTSTSESKTKDAHLDVRIALNQTDDEKDLDIARLNVIFHRHKDFNGRDEVLITQRLATSQPLIDNIRLFSQMKKFQVIKKKS